MDELYRRMSRHNGAGPPRDARVGDCNFLMMRIVFSSGGLEKAFAVARLTRIAAQPISKHRRRNRVQLNFDADVESFRAEFVAFLDTHTPTAAESLQRS